MGKKNNQRTISIHSTEANRILESIPKSKRSMYIEHLILTNYNNPLLNILRKNKH